MGVDAVRFFASARNALRSLRPPTGGVAVESRTGARLCDFGVGPFPALAVSRTPAIRSYIIKHSDCDRLHQRCDRTRETFTSLRLARRRLRPGVHSRTGHRRMAGHDESAAALLGCRRPQPVEFLLRTLRIAGIARSRKAAAEAAMEECESARRLAAASFAH